MRILIVEDNAFNAFCLTRLLQAACPHVLVTVVNDSISALNALESDAPSLVILDGDLGVSDGLRCNGPALADAIWQHSPSLPLVAWSDSENMQQAFSKIFRQHKKNFNDLSCWPKIVSQERISQSLALLFPQFSNETTSGVTSRAELLHA